MAESKSKSHKVGETVEVKEGGTVTRPNGEQATVSGGLYVLDVPGTFEIDGEEVTAK